LLSRHLQAPDIKISLKQTAIKWVTKNNKDTHVAVLTAQQFTGFG
jgi:hypothetical protein